jgi:hypothetical protein
MVKNGTVDEFTEQVLVLTIRIVRTKTRAPVLTEQ